MSTERCKVTVALVNVRHVEIPLFHTSSTTDKSMDRLHISVRLRDIETKLFTESDDRTALRPENMENV